MSGMIWVLIPLAAILGWIFLEYQENKLRMMKKNEENREDVEKLHQAVTKLQKRIENLEAIAAAAPDDFSSQNNRSPGIEMEDTAMENEVKVSKIARKQKQNG